MIIIRIKQRFFFINLYKNLTVFLKNNIFREGEGRGGKGTEWEKKGRERRQRGRKGMEVV